MIELLICEVLNSYSIIYTGFSGRKKIGRKLLKPLVRAEGFEPPASCSQNRCHPLALSLCFQVLIIQ